MSPTRYGEREKSAREVLAEEQRNAAKVGQAVLRSVLAMATYLDAKPEAEVTATTPADDARTVLVNRVAWGAVLAGVATSLAIQLVLNILGVAAGMATLDPLTTDNPTPGAFTMGAALWWTISGIIAAAVGGYVAGRTSGSPKEETAGWHGFTAWAATTLVIFFIAASSVGAVLGGAFSALGSAFGGTVQTAATTAAAGAAARPDAFSGLEQQIRAASAGNDPAALRDAAVSSVRAALTGDAAQANDAKERAAQIVSRAEGISIEDARTRVGEYEKQYRDAEQQARQKATEAADTATKILARGSLVIAIALMFGALAAWFAGSAGAVAPTMTAAFFGTRLLR
jgi:hypothetical protein